MILDINQDAVEHLCSSILNLFPLSNQPSSSSSLQTPTTISSHNDSSLQNESQEVTTNSQNVSLENNSSSDSSIAIWVSYDMVHPHDAFGKMMR